MSIVEENSFDFENIFTLKEKIILVTGSNQGNGHAIASGLLQAKAKVIRIDREFTSPLPGADDWVFDLSNINQIANTIDKIAKKYGRIDALVNNAGVSFYSNAPYQDYRIYNDTLLVNLHAAFYLCAAVCPIMAKNRGGAIVNITSLGAELGFSGNPSYQISKSGLRQLTKALAKDWGEYGIRANNICPGYIKTNMTKASYADPVLHEQRKSRMIAQRWGKPEDLVGPVIFLLSNASDYITGTDIYVDGGWTANGL